MFRSLASVPVPTIGLALPAAAQQLTGQDPHQIAENLMKMRRTTHDKYRRDSRSHSVVFDISMHILLFMALAFLSCNAQARLRPGETVDPQKYKWYHKLQKEGKGCCDIADCGPVRSTMNPE